VVDPKVLGTLPETELSNGLAEVIKHGVIGDPELFHLLSTNINPNKERNIVFQWDEIVKRSMAVKIKYILEDPYERNVRAVLNYGHTIGHAVEWASGYRIKHGEAVAIGMVAEANLAERIGLSEPGLSEKIAAALLAARLPIGIPTWIDKQAILQAIRKDKKRKAGKVNFSLPIRVGEVQPGIELEENEIWPIF
jgi:3-dehydroquinate synthetase